MVSTFFLFIVILLKFDNFLGDSGYPLEPWILTPYRNAAEASAEALFNEKFSKARSLVERVFGVMKGRFRCLLAARELHYDPPKVVRIMNVCCALHNICCEFNVELPTEEIVESEHLPQSNNNIPNSSNYNSSSNNYTNIARNIRDEIKNNMI